MNAGARGKPPGWFIMQGPIVAIVGPTGVGKTALALDLAPRLGAEILNLDSRQVYQGLDIGAAKPTAMERARVPHHLFDVVAPDEHFDCACYRELARAAIAALARRGRRALLVGGTGLYLKALRHGLCGGPPRDPALRAELEASEDAQPGALHARLSAVDPSAARRVHPHDRVRLVRALEVHVITGRPLSAWQAEHGFRTAEFEVRVLGLTLERSVMVARIEARCEAMVADGLVEEVQGLWGQGYGPELPALQSIGYREIGAYLQGRCTREEALAAMARATRQLAKRQLTWFRAVPDLRWHDAAGLRVEDVLTECG